MVADDLSKSCGKFTKPICANWENMNLQFRDKFVMPVPMMNILNGGKHAKNTVDFQEFMIMPVGAGSFSDALRMGTEVYHTLKKILTADGKNTAVGDEGGFAPDLKDAFEVFDYLTKAVEEAGYVCGKDMVFAMDAAASELYEENSGMYFSKASSSSVWLRESSRSSGDAHSPSANVAPIFMLTTPRDAISFTVSRIVCMLPL